MAAMKPLLAAQAHSVVAWLRLLPAGTGAVLLAAVVMGRNPCGWPRQTGSWLLAFALIDGSLFPGAWLTHGIATRRLGWAQF